MLPEALIAQEALAVRSESRMLVVDRGAGTWRDSSFRGLPEFIRAGDCLVVNNSRVIPARLLGKRRSEGGGAAEVFLTKPVSQNPVRWQALVRPGKRLKVGSVIDFEGATLLVVAEGDHGLRAVEFSGMSESEATAWIESHGHVPLPPYIRRDDRTDDRDRYQTIFADRKGSVAAPTAGLHFDETVVEALKRKRASIEQITLHVGMGTFQAVNVDRVEDHQMHEEWFEITSESAKAIESADRVIAVGTTSVRTLEHIAAVNEGVLKAATGSTKIVIAPGFEFQIVGGLLTNFHLPRSTLLMLVAAFAGRELTMDAYAHAIREKYRFYSYGDCMLIV